MQSKGTVILAIIFTTGYCAVFTIALWSNVTSSGFPFPLLPNIIMTICLISVTIMTYRCWRILVQSHRSGSIADEGERLLQVLMERREHVGGVRRNMFVTTHVAIELDANDRDGSRVDAICSDLNQVLARLSRRSPEQVQLLWMPSKNPTGISRYCMTDVVLTLTTRRDTLNTRGDPQRKVLDGEANICLNAAVEGLSEIVGQIVDTHCGIRHWRVTPIGAEQPRYTAYPDQDLVFNSRPWRPNVR